MKNVPKAATSRKEEKKVKIPYHLDINGKPVWRFSSVDKDGPFKWPKGEQTELDIVSKLHEFDSMYWSKIEGKHHHFLSESSISTKAKKRLEEIKLEDEIDQLFSFSLQGKPRIIAIRHQDVAILLWYDPEHHVAPSSKKHT
jgi:hypothetical protein